jgi:DNA mismatch endonuclease (patch repair protein)
MPANRASASMLGNRRVNTRPELRLRSELHRLGLRFRVDHPIRTTGGVVHPDIVFTRHRVAVFVDGCFWHVCTEHGHMPKSNQAYWTWKLAQNVARDARVTRQLTSLGWRVVRTWEHEPTSEAAQAVMREFGASPAACPDSAAASADARRG